MIEQDIKPLPPQRPNTDDQQAWLAYWEENNQPWRTEPEINKERQQYLAEQRAIVPNIEQGIYPFKNIKLSRADVEWLLATHENGRGPINWGDEQQRSRKGLDLRGAILSSEDLRNLPLARMYGGLTVREWDSAKSEEKREWAKVHLEGAKLNGAHLEGADLSGAYLEGAILSRVFLERVYMVEVHLEGARLYKAHLEQAYLREAHLEGSDLTRSYLNGTDLTRAHLEGKRMIPLDLDRIREWNKTFPTILPPTQLSGAFFDIATNLENTVVGDKKLGFVSLADLHWGDVYLLTVDWAAVKMLGDEQKARQKKTLDGKMKGRLTRLEEHQAAVRANRQLAVALQGQGLNEEADHFAYRAKKLQNVVFWQQKKFGKYFFSAFLDQLAGYGYRPLRSVLWYLTVIVGFALAYYTFGHLPLFPDTFVYSLTSFHGRGFFPGLQNKPSLHDPLVMLAALEAVIGLFIEISFIATFTQRFFGK